MTVQTSDVAAPRSLARRRVLALGAAGLVTAALAACGTVQSAATQVAATAPANGTVNAAGSTVQSAATQVAASAPVTGSIAAAATSQLPGAASGVLGTAQAVASQNPGIGGTVQAAAGGTVQAAATQASGGAAPGGSTVAAGSTAGATVAAASGGDPASRNNKYAGKPPALTIDKTKKYVATIVTNKGTMKAELYADTAPLSVNNFVFLANDHFYDNVIFHRIVKSFVIQGGDPTGLGTGGPGYKFSDEQSSFSRSYEKGTLAMANSGPNTNGSQFFICLDSLTAQNKLPKMYNIFGKVTEGLDVVDKIAATPTMRGASGENSTPTEKVFMQTVTIGMQ